MVARTYQIDLNQGADFALVFLWKLGPTIEEAEPVNLTGYTGRMTVWTRAGDEVLSLTTENGGMEITPDAMTGAVKVVISDVQSLAFDQLRYRYLIELISSGGLVWPFLLGPLIVNARG